MIQKPIVIDLFSGCGGFGLGAKMAGFDCRVAIDIDKTLQSSYRLNFPSTQVILEDIAKLGPEQWALLLKGATPGETLRPDGIIGGPPCQGFSRIGKRDTEDPRNTLIGHFFRHVKMLRPKFFVMENVEGLLDEGSVDALMSELENISQSQLSIKARKSQKFPAYTVLDPILIRASDYGAPTTRTRVIVVGYLAGEMESLSVEDFLPSPHITKTTVKDAIADLPEPSKSSRKKGDYAWGNYRNMRGKKISQYAKRAREIPSSDFGNEYIIKKLKNGKISGLDITNHTEEVVRRFSALPNGKIDPIGKSTKLDWDGYCPTIRAGTGSDKGSYQSVRPIHPETPRVITVREAARLQGFPDWFAFHETKWSSFRMIGNSVSPIISELILSTIRKRLEIKIAPIRSTL